MVVRFKEKYTLYLSWDKIEYKEGLIAVLKSPKLNGAALSHAARIEDKDHIDLDVTSQNIILISSWDIVRFSWNKVVHQDSLEARFDKAFLSSPELYKTKILSDNDRIIIDTEDHEEEVHVNNFVYKALIAKADNSDYNYKDK